MSKMSSQTTLTPQKAAERARKLNLSGPSGFCRICTSSFAIHLGILGKKSYMSAKNIFQRRWHSSTTMSVRIFIL